MWFVYIIETSDRYLYTGITKDVERRLQEHMQGKGSKYLRGKGILKVVFTLSVANRSLASKLEYKIKQLSKYDKQEIIAGRMRLE